MNENQYLLQLKNVHYSVFNHKILTDININLEKNEILGFVGANGSGKTTSMRIIAGILYPTLGQVLIKDQEIRLNPVASKRVIGYLPERAPLYPNMSVFEYLSFIAHIYFNNKDTINSRIDYVINLSSLKEVLKQKIKTLSKGFKSRVSLAGTILPDPEILILDEPTDGLDYFQKETIYKLISNLKNKAILFSTHNLVEVKELCSRVVLIDKGSIVKKVNKVDEIDNYFSNKLINS